jgi:hypothetical protein
MAVPPFANAIFDYLTGKPPAAGSPADRVRKAVLDPGVDPEMDTALLQFRTVHKGLEQSPATTIAVATFQEELARDWAKASGKATAATPRPPRANWQDLFDRLLKHCRALFGGTVVPSGADTPERLVSTTVSTYLSRAEAGQFGDLEDPNQLWPVLLEIAARKANRKLSARVLDDVRFGQALTGVLEEAFKDVAPQKSRQMVLVLSLFGRSPEQIEAQTHELREDIEADVRALHAELHAWLKAA